MAATVTISKRSQWGDRINVQATIAFSGTYPTGGEVIVPSNFNLQVIERLLFEGLILDGSSTALLPTYNATTGKVMCFEGVAAGAPFAEKTASEVYVAGSSIRVMAIGT